MENIEYANDLYVVAESGFQINKSIENSAFGLFHIESEIKTLQFKNCAIKVAKIYCQKNSDNKLIFDNCEIESLEVEGYEDDENSKKNYLRIGITGRNTKIKEVLVNGRVAHFNANGGSYEKITLNSYDQTILGRIKLSRITTDHLSVFSFKRSIINILNSSIALCQLEHLETTKCKFSDNEKMKLQISQCSLDDLTFQKFNEGSLSLFSSQVDFLYFGSVNFTELTVSGECRILKNHSLPLSTKVCDVLTLEHCLIQEGSKFHFSRFEFEKIYFVDMENLGSIELNSCEIKNDLSLIRSKIGNTVINDLELTHANRFNIRDSNIEDAKFLNIKWKNHYKLVESLENLDKQEKINSRFSLRESYRQLKTNYVSNGNQIEALEFKKHELRIHYEITKYLANESLRSKRDLFKNIGNFLILWTHKNASDFSQNIWKPLFLLFISHLALYNTLVHWKLGLELDVFHPDWKITLEAAGQFLNTILPTHSNELKNFVTGYKQEIPGIIDFPMRVLSGYFLFYFISASRKYHQN